MEGKKRRHKYVNYLSPYMFEQVADEHETDPAKLNKEVRRLRDVLIYIAQLCSYYGDTTPESIQVARHALGCKKMPYGNRVYRSFED